MIVASPFKTYKNIKSATVEFKNPRWLYLSARQI